MSVSLLFNLQIDCEATQMSMRNPDLGERAICGLARIFEETGTKGTFLVISTDIEAHGKIYIELEKAGHEIGLHFHPDRSEICEFLGVQSRESQYEILTEAMDRFAQVMGRLPKAFCPGYCSANDHTFGVLEELKFTHGCVSFPTRNLPQCACVWGNSPLDSHYPHRYQKSLAGDVNFVDLPVTIDPESRMWGGAHPQDLRVELVDAKNHWYTVDKAVRRQISQKSSLIQIHAITHNVFEYGDSTNFRRETYLGIVKAVRQIAEREQLSFQPATLGEIADQYRKINPIESIQCPKLHLDVRGR